MLWRAAAVLLAMLVSRSALAQNAADVQMARRLGTEGLRLAQSGDCAGAVDKLSRAEKLHHAPTTLARLGECQIALGHYVEGTENLRLVIRERLDRGAPAPFVAAKARAEKSLDAALPHIGKLRVDVVGPRADDVRWTLDGQSISSASLGVERPIDPGAHAVEASAAGFKTSSGKVDIGDGGSQTLTLTLERTPELVSTTIAKPTFVTHRVYWPAAVAFGIAGASAVLTATFGSIAFVKKNDLTAACGGTSCPPTELGAFNDVNTFASVANVGLIVAGVATLAGVVLVIVAPKRTVERVSIGPFGVAGTF